MSVNHFLAEDIWETIRESIPAEKRKVLANNIIDMFEDEDIHFDYEDSESQLLIDAGVVEFDEDEVEEIV
jgi:hypothetical protein